MTLTVASRQRRVADSEGLEDCLMRCKVVVLWCIVNEKRHPLFPQDEKFGEIVLRLIDALFPGIDYFMGPLGFSELVLTIFMPTMKRRYADLLVTPGEAIDGDSIVDVKEMLPCRGYQWQDDPSWQRLFQDKLAAI